MANRSEQDKERARDAEHTGEIADTEHFAPDVNERGGFGQSPTPAETASEVKAAKKAADDMADDMPVTANVQADPGLAAEHQRAHDEGREAEFHRAVELATRHPDEPALEPEFADEGKLAETAPMANAPTAAELRAMGREIKPLVEPTDVSSDRYPHKVEQYTAEERRRIDETGECPTCGQRLPKALRPRELAAAR